MLCAVLGRVTWSWLGLQCLVAWQRAAVAPTDTHTHLLTVCAVVRVCLPAAVKGQPGREGSLAKSFKWTRDKNGNAYFVNVYMTDKTAGPEKKTTATCSVTPAEFAVFKQLVLQSISAMYGFDLAMGSIG